MDVQTKVRPRSAILSQYNPLGSLPSDEERAEVTVRCSSNSAQVEVVFPFFVRHSVVKHAHLFVYESVNLHYEVIETLHDGPRKSCRRHRSHARFEDQMMQVQACG